MEANNSFPNAVNNTDIEPAQNLAEDIRYSDYLRDRASVELAIDQATSPLDRARLRDQITILEEVRLTLVDSIAPTSA